MRRRYSPTGSDSASASQRCPPDTRTPQFCIQHFAFSIHFDKLQFITKILFFLLTRQRKSDTILFGF